MPRINEPSPTYSHQIHFSPSHAIKQMRVYTSSLYSCAKKNCSVQSVKQNLVSWIKGLFRPYYLRWTCMKDLESFKRAFEENPCICLQTFIDTLPKNPLKTNEILRSIFREQCDHPDRYPTPTESNIDELLDKILLSPSLFKLKKQLISLEYGDVEQSQFVKNSNEVNRLVNQFQKWETMLPSVKRFSKYILVFWEESKNNLNQQENKVNFNKAIDKINAFFNDLHNEQEVPRPYKVLLEKTCRLLSDSRHRENLFAIFCDLLWEYNVNYGKIYGKIWVEGEHGPFKPKSKFIYYCKAALRCIGIRI